MFSALQIAINRSYIIRVNVRTNSRTCQRMSLSILFLLLIAVLFVPCVCGAEQDTSHQEMLKLIPEPLPAGAASQGAASFYGPDNLYQYMDGGADIFVLYGVTTLLHQEFRAKEVDVTVDIFDMGSPDSAFGMYAAERAPNYRFIKMGAEGYKDEGILNFFQDRYYVKLAGFGTGADAVLDAFAVLLSGKIGTNSSVPAMLSQMPSEGRKPHSEQYMPKDPLGHAFLGPAYVIAYSSGDQESKLFLTVARDREDAQQRLDQLKQHFSKTGQCKDAPEVGEGAIRANNSFEGTVIAQVKGRYLLVLVNPAANEGLIQAPAAKLQ